MASNEKAKSITHIFNISKKNQIFIKIIHSYTTQQKNQKHQWFHPPQT